MRLIKITIFAMAVMLLQGCAAALIGGYYYDEASIRETRQKYLEEFNKTNIARETNGLKPLELCAYKDSMDKEWAEEDANCNN